MAEERKVAEEGILTEEQRVTGERKVTEEQKFAGERKVTEEQKFAEGQNIAEKQKFAEGQNIAEKQKFAKEQRGAEDPKISRMRELVGILNNASRAYYAENREIMSNLEFDALYDELVSLENETGAVLAGSPTQKVGYESVDGLPKETHASPMLSLDKTKDTEVLRAFIGEHNTLISWKLDGLTVVLQYSGGTLVKAVTRGNGIVGDVITPNAKVFENIPLRIPFQGELILRGEAVITYPDFEKINASLAQSESLYKNPRNLCSGSVRQLNSEVTAKRHVRFYAFSLVQADGVDFSNSRKEQFIFLSKQGFEVVEYLEVTSATLDEAIAWFEEKIKTFEIPSDGLVALYDDIAYGESLGTTAKSPRNAMAFKWQDEEAETTLLEIEWSPSRTGAINPVAIFEPVELEGTTVSRASVHNISILKKLKLGVGDRITVYKANMIIPQIAQNLTGSGPVKLPLSCPVCGMPVHVYTAEGSETQTLMCPNPDCPAKQIKAFSQFVSRDAMNIEGLSEMTLEKFISRMYIRSFADIYRLKTYADEIASMEGFGEKSVENLINSIERSRHTTLPRVLFALGIPNVGVANAKVISRAFEDDIGRLRKAGEEEISEVEGVGPVMAGACVQWFSNEKNVALLDDLLSEITIEKSAPSGTGANEETGGIAGKTFVVTGTVNHFRSRRELQARIEEAGGKVTGSVSKKTDYLINNDASSTSGKNMTAKKLGIPIITEEEFLVLLGDIGRQDLEDA